MSFKILIEPLALEDIQQAIDYYDERQIGLGKRFENELNGHLSFLMTNPFFQIRYDEVHCLPLNKFPFMIHYTINESKKSVIIRGVFHTSLNPDKWKKR